MATVRLLSSLQARAVSFGFSCVSLPEFRIPLPIDINEFRRGLLYSVSLASKNETGGGEGAEFIKQCEFFDDPTILPGKTLSGVYSYKIYRLKSKVPWVLQKLFPEQAFEVHEESWNAYPYCKTILTNPGYMGDDSFLLIESIHLPDNGTSENPLNVDKKRDIVYLDICDDEAIGVANYRPELDPKIFLSSRTGRGQLRENWMETVSPRSKPHPVVYISSQDGMVAWYSSLVRNDVLLQNCKHTVQMFGNRQLRRADDYEAVYKNICKFSQGVSNIFRGGECVMLIVTPTLTGLKKNAFCWIDDWFDLTDEELQKFDEEVAEELKSLFNSMERRGVTFDD